jgi:hypothetical protein
MSMRRALLLLPLLCLLAACGGEEGNPRLRVVLSYSDRDRPYMPMPEAVAKQIAGDLEEVGFTVELRKEEWAQYLPMTRRGEHQLALMGWSADVADADNFLYVLLDKSNARPGSAQNISFYTDETVHALLEKARYTWDEAERAVLYRQAQEKILADAPMVPLAYSRRVIAHRKGVGPIALEPTTHPLLRLAAEPKGGCSSCAGETPWISTLRRRPTARAATSSSRSSTTWCATSPGPRRSSRPWPSRGATTRRAGSGPSGSGTASRSTTARRATPRRS